MKGYCFSALISHEIMSLKNNQNVGNLLLFVVNHVGVKMAESFAANAERDFVLQKPGKKNQSCWKGVFLSQLPTKPNGRFKFFHEWQINRKVQSSCTWCWWRILRLWRFVQSSVVEYRFGKYGCQHLNYWLSKFVQEVANSEEKGYLARTLYEIICGIRKHLEETVGSEVLNRLDTSDKR